MVAGPMAESITRITSDRGISLEVRGEGAPILLLHGIGGSSASCAPLARRLAAQGLRTYAWDAPGYGASTDPVGQIDLVAELAMLIEEIGAPVHLFGTSWGGVLAMELAATRPELVSALVVADSTRGSGTSPRKAAAMRARVGELVELGPRAFAAGRAGKLVSPRCAPQLAAEIVAVMSQVRVLGYSAAAEYMASRDVEPLLHAIACPTVVVVGADDRVTGVDESQLLAAGIEGATFAIIENAGHAALTERPDAMAQQVLELVRAVVR